MGHRRSSSSSGSGSDSDSSSKHKHKEKKKDKKEKKDKDKKEKKQDKHSNTTASNIPTTAPGMFFPSPPQPPGYGEYGYGYGGGHQDASNRYWDPSGGPPAPPLQPQGPAFSYGGERAYGHGEAAEFFGTGPPPPPQESQFRSQEYGNEQFRSREHDEGHDQWQGQGQEQSYQRPPPSGFRVPLSADAQFPSPRQAGPPPCRDADGVSPVYFGSAIFPNAVHPCKVAPHLPNPCRVPYGGRETEHNDRYDLLPFTQDMELIPASGGHVPPDRRPVEGGYEECNGRDEKLYHAVATINGVRVPGKSGEHLGGANVAFAGQEHAVRDYELLVWRQ